MTENRQYKKKIGCVKTSKKYFCRTFSGRIQTKKKHDLQISTKFSKTNHRGKKRMKITSFFLASLAFFGFFEGFAFFCSCFCLRAARAASSLLRSSSTCLGGLREVCFVRAICLKNEMRNDEWVLLKTIFVETTL